MIRDAIIEGNHRYSLTREWDVTNKNRTLFIMLNPSTADEQQDDRTTNRCIDFAKRWGCGSLEICNLFSYRTTYPRDLRTLSYSEIIGEKNHYHLERAFKKATIIVTAWGEHGKLHKQSTHIHPLLKQWSRTYGKAVYCLGFLNNKEPRHPLYAPAATERIDFLTDSSFDGEAIMQNWQTIIQVAGEGGSISLFGLQQADKRWIFSRHINEMDYGIDDIGGISHSSHAVHTWEDGLNLLNRFPWPHLRPITVHPDFEQRIWEEVQNHTIKRRSRLKDWKEICHID
ncbi:TPA: DUF1643 domain-containing protein [Bacillus cereus]